MILVWRCILRTLCVVMYHILLIAYGHGIHAKVCGSMTAVFMFSSSGLYCPIRRSPIPAILMISTRSPFGVPWHHLVQLFPLGCSRGVRLEARGFTQLQPKFRPLLIPAMWPGS